ncbi:MAG: hypothetical protein QN147_03595 [Armatimonadota bacterium]|nr:hypothetical protein [Armatimonadota bacterium]
MSTDTPTPKPPGKSGDSQPAAFADTLGAVGAPAGDGDDRLLQIAPNTVLRNRHELDEHLGSCGMDSVYSAYDRLVGHEVAPKFDPWDLASRTALKRAREPPIRSSGRADRLASSSSTTPPRRVIRSPGSSSAWDTSSIRRPTAPPALLAGHPARLRPGDRRLRHAGGLDGLQVISQLKTLQPTCMRALTTGRGDFPMAVEPVNQGQDRAVPREAVPPPLFEETVTEALEIGRRLAIS